MAGLQKSTKSMIIKTDGGRCCFITKSHYAAVGYIRPVLLYYTNPYAAAWACKIYSVSQNSGNILLFKVSSVLDALCLQFSFNHVSLRATAGTAIARLSYSRCVCPSVTPLYCDIVTKQRNIRS